MKNEPIDKAIERLTKTTEPVNINEFLKQMPEGYLGCLKRDIKEKPEMFGKAEE